MTKKRKTKSVKKAARKPAKRKVKKTLRRAKKSVRAKRIAAMSVKPKMVEAVSRRTPGR